MNYKAYPDRHSTPQRMSRKRLRRDVFIANKKMAKAIRKANRLKRKSLETDENSLGL